MGAELILATAAMEQDTTLDWDAAYAAIDDPDNKEDLWVWASDVHPWIEEGEIQEVARRDMMYFRSLLEEDWRGTQIFDVRGVRLLVAGGESWGDDPNEAFTVVNSIAFMPEAVRSALGLLSWREVRGLT